MRCEWWRWYVVVQFLMNILIDLKGSADGVAMECTRKRGIKADCRVWGLNNQKDGVVTIWDREDYGQTRVWEEDEEVRFWMLNFSCLLESSGDGYESLEFMGLKEFQVSSKAVSIVVTTSCSFVLLWTCGVIKNIFDLCPQFLAQTSSNP